MPWQNTGGGNGGSPWGGGRPGGGPGGGGPRRPGGGGGQPPDIDAAIRKAQARLRRFLPGGGSRGGVLLLVLILLSLWAASGLYRVNTDQQGVVLRFGEWVDRTGPGLHWHIPWPVESVLTPNVTTRQRTDIGFRAGMSPDNRPASLRDESLMLTGDENIVDIAFTVFWQIKDAGNFLFNIQSPQDLTVKSVAESVMREVIGQTQIQQALTEGRADIQKAVAENIQTVLDSYEAGIKVLGVSLEKVDPPREVIDAFRDVQAAEADRERFRNEADRFANTIIPEARGEANRAIQSAEAYREQIIAAAQGDADRFLSVYESYKQAEDVTRKRIYLETMEKIMGRIDKVIVDGEAGSGVVPYMALPEIRKRSGQQSGSGGQQQ